MIKHATIVSGIGGTTIASETVFGGRPTVILSYPEFEGRDSHLLKYYDNEIDYRVIGKDDMDGVHAMDIDVWSTTCPCAGLSSMTPSSHAESEHNDWMIKSSEFVLENFKPKVFWGETAPRLTSTFGKPVLDRIREVGKRHGYSLSVYETFAYNHDVAQVRKRAFYFFWADGKVPIFPWTERSQFKKVEDLITESKSSTTDPMWNYTKNKGKPSDDLYYRYILDVIHNGISHKEFSEMIDHTTNVFKYIEKEGHSYYDVGDWAEKNGYKEKQCDLARLKQKKLDSGANITRKGVIIPKNYTAAFVGPMSWNSTHPIEDRYINIREALSIMGFPDSMEVIKPNVNFKDLTKSVPVNMAIEMVRFINMNLMGELTKRDTDFIIQDNRNKIIKELNSLEDFLQ